MRPRSIRRLAVAVAFAVVPARAQDAEGLRLRIEKQLHMAPTRPARDSAKFIEADHLEGSQDKNVVATGNVTLRQRGATIRADRVDYFGDDQTAIATGHVRLEREGDVASGPTLTYHLDTETGEMETPTLEFPKKPERRVASRGRAERALLEAEQKSRLIKAEYTSCVAPRDDWFIRVSELDIDGSRNVALASHTTVYFLGLPILYSPYLSFPLDNKRRTGFLAPTFGTSGKSGFEASLPYYWNIAESMDATLTPKTFTKRGLQLGAEFRYLEPKFSGQLDGEFLPNDKIAERDRYFLGWRHVHQLWTGWTASVNAQKVSDDDYFRDLTTKIALTSQTNLPRDARLDYNDDTWSATARVLGYQTLQDPLRLVPIPYNILPQLLASGARQNVYGFDWQVAGELSNFRHPVLPNGQRFIVYPTLSFPMRQSYGYVIPKIGYHFTRYNLSDNAVGLESDSRAVPISSLDAGLFFERPMTWGTRAFLQTLEPRLYYLNVARRDRLQFPAHLRREPLRGRGPDRRREPAHPRAHLAPHRVGHRPGALQGGLRAGVLLHAAARDPHRDDGRQQVLRHPRLRLEPDVAVGVGGPGLAVHAEPVALGESDRRCALFARAGQHRERGLSLRARRGRPGRSQLLGHPAGRPFHTVAGAAQRLGAGALELEHQGPQAPRGPRGLRV